MNLYELNKKLKNARRTGFIFNQINILLNEFFSNVSNINIHYYPKFQIAMCHRQFSSTFSQNPENV